MMGEQIQNSGFATCSGVAAGVSEFRVKRHPAAFRAFCYAAVTPGVLFVFSCPCQSDTAQPHRLKLTLAEKRLKELFDV
jgi:hypothetical protein